MDPVSEAIAAAVLSFLLFGPPQVEVIDNGNDRGPKVIIQFPNRIPDPQLCPPGVNDGRCVMDRRPIPPQQQVQPQYPNIPQRRDRPPFPCPDGCKDFEYDPRNRN